MAASSARVFLSYRRDDSKDIAGRLRDHLVRKLGSEGVFKDVDSIHPGDDFREALDDAIAKCDVALILIGERWLDARDAAGNRRLEEAGDFVRQEVLAALASGKRVIPVLVGKAAMPAASALPEPLRPLAFRHAAKLRDDPDFRIDVARLVRSLPGQKAPPIYWMNLGLLALFAVLGTLWAVFHAGWLGAMGAIATWAGIFAILGGAAKLLPRPRVEQLMRRLDGMLINRRATVALGAALAAALVLGSFVGALRISVAGPRTAYDVRVAPPSGRAPTALTLAAGSTRHLLFWTTPWSGRELEVRVNGFPPRRERVRGFGRRTLEVPRSFLKPVVLARSGSLLVADTPASRPAGKPLVYRVRINGRERDARPFQGGTVCIGCDGAIGIPEAVREEWNTELERLQSLPEDQGGLSAGEAERLRSSWMVIADARPDVDLNPGDRVSIEVLVPTSGAPSVFARSGEIRIEEPTSESPGPATLVLGTLP